MDPQISDFVFRVLPIGISLFAAGFTVFSFWSGHRRSKQETALSLHSKLFETCDDFALIYEPTRNLSCYFSQQGRGRTKNFLGTDEEKKVDLFLQRLNLVCQWLLSFKCPGDEDELFRVYIKKLYTAPFFRRYFSFLDDEEPESNYFRFIHEYAAKRLKLPRPRTHYATSLAELELLSPPAPIPLMTEADILLPLPAR